MKFKVKLKVTSSLDVNSYFLHFLAKQEICVFFSQLHIQSPDSAPNSPLTVYWGDSPAYVGFEQISSPHCFSLYFPKLTFLALGRLNFLSEDQFSWILKHPTLETLILDDCMITHHGVFDDERTLVLWSDQNEASDLVPEVVEDDEPPRLHKFKYRWHCFFDRAREEFKQLRDFLIGIGTWASSGHSVEVSRRARAGRTRFRTPDKLKHRTRWH